MYEENRSQIRDMEKKERSTRILIFQADERHFKGVDRQTGLALRSILSVPLCAKECVIGVLQVVDADADRFNATDLALLEPLATTAATATLGRRKPRVASSSPTPSTT